MHNSDAQMRAIKLSQGDASAESRAPMDMEGRVHTCPACGHEMPMDEVLGRPGGIKLTEADKSAESGAHMDKEGEVK